MSLLKTSNMVLNHNRFYVSNLQIINSIKNSAEFKHYQQEYFDDFCKFHETIDIKTKSKNNGVIKHYSRYASLQELNNLDHSYNLIGLFYKLNKIEGFNGEENFFVDLFSGMRFVTELVYILLLNEMELYTCCNVVANALNFIPFIKEIKLKPNLIYKKLPCLIRKKFYNDNYYWSSIDENELIDIEEELNNKFSPLSEIYDFVQTYKTSDMNITEASNLIMNAFVNTIKRTKLNKDTIDIMTNNSVQFAFYPFNLTENAWHYKDNRIKFKHCKTIDNQVKRSTNFQEKMTAFDEALEKDMSEEILIIEFINQANAKLEYIRQRQDAYTKEEKLEKIQDVINDYNKATEVINNNKAICGVMKSINRQINLIKNDKPLNQTKITKKAVKMKSDVTQRRSKSNKSVITNTESIVEEDLFNYAESIVQNNDTIINKETNTNFTNTPSFNSSSFNSSSNTINNITTSCAAKSKTKSKTLHKQKGRLINEPIFKTKTVNKNQVDKFKEKFEKIYSLGHTFCFTINTDIEVWKDLYNKDLIIKGVKNFYNNPIMNDKEAFDTFLYAVLENKQYDISFQSYKNKFNNYFEDIDKKQVDYLLGYLIDNNYIEFETFKKVTTNFLKEVNDILKNEDFTCFANFLDFGLRQNRLHAHVTVSFEEETELEDAKDYINSLSSKFNTNVKFADVKPVTDVNGWLHYLTNKYTNHYSYAYKHVLLANNTKFAGTTYNLSNDELNDIKSDVKVWTKEEEKKYTTNKLLEEGLNVIPMDCKELFHCSKGIYFADKQTVFDLKFKIMEVDGLKQTMKTYEILKNNFDKFNGIEVVGRVNTRDWIAWCQQELDAEYEFVTRFTDVLLDKDNLNEVKRGIKTILENEALENPEMDVEKEYNECCDDLNNCHPYNLEIGGHFGNNNKELIKQKQMNFIKFLIENNITFDIF